MNTKKAMYPVRERKERNLETMANEELILAAKLESQAADEREKARMTSDAFERNFALSNARDIEERAMMLRSVAEDRLK